MDRIAPLITAMEPLSALFNSPPPSDPSSITLSLLFLPIGASTVTGNGKGNGAGNGISCTVSSCTGGLGESRLFSSRLMLLEASILLFRTFLGNNYDKYR